MTDIRNMVLTDAEQVANIQLLAWKKAYANILPEPYLDNLNQVKKRKSWEQGFFLNADAVRLVAEIQSEVVGFVVGLENITGDKLSNPDGELWALYVHPDHWKQGVGFNLFNSFKSHLKKKGFRSMLIWVLEQNLMARNFYLKTGATLYPDQRTTNYGGKELIEVCYVTSL